MIARLKNEEQTDVVEMSNLKWEQVAVVISDNYRGQIVCRCTSGFYVIGGSEGTNFSVNCTNKVRILRPGELIEVQ